MLVTTVTWLHLFTVLMYSLCIFYDLGKQKAQQLGFSQLVDGKQIWQPASQPKLSDARAPPAWRGPWRTRCCRYCGGCRGGGCYENRCFSRGGSFCLNAGFPFLAFMKWRVVFMTTLQSVLFNNKRKRIHSPKTWWAINSGKKGW